MKSSITLVYRYVLLNKPGWMFKSSSDLIHRKISKFYDLCWFQLEITKSSFALTVDIDVGYRKHRAE